MKAVFGFKVEDAPKRSTLDQCHIISRTDDDADYLFCENETGELFITLTNYLICPREMFSQRQVNAASKKYLAKTGAKDVETTYVKNFTS